MTTRIIKLFNQMNRCWIGANLNLFRYATMVLVLMLGVGNAWAGGDTYYSKVTVSGTPTGAGTVYVKAGSSFSGTNTSDTNNGTSQSQTYSIKATPNAGYAFKSWSGSSVTISSTTTASTTCTINATATSSSSPTTGSATATFEAIKVTAAPADVTINATDPSATYPDAAGVVVGFTTSSSNTNGDFTTGGSGDSRWTISAWPTHASATSTTFNYKFVGNGSYGTNNRTFTKTVTLKGLNDATVKTCTLTAKYPNPRVIECNEGSTDLTIYPTFKASDATQEAVEKTAVFDVVYADNANNFSAAFSGATGGGTWTVTGISVDQANQKATVTYTFGGNKIATTHTAVLTLTAANCQGWDDTSAAGGASATVTLTAENTQEATDDAVVIAADGTTVIYQGDWATAWTRANTAANAGCTLYLLRNVGGLTAYQEVKNTFTLDLNGKILSGKRSGTLIYLNTAGKTLTIKDSKTGGKIQHINNEYAGTPVCVNVTKGSLILESGTLYCENQGASGRKAGGVICKAGTTFTMNGGKIDVWGYNGAYGVSQESDKNDNTIFNMNNGEITVLGYSDIYGISAAGKVNVKDGATINATATYSNCRGITLTASANATAANCYYGQLTMTGGTINSTCTANADGTRYAYGIVLEGSYTASMGTGVATDGSHANKAAATGTIENATINVSTLGRYAYGVLANGSYQSKTNHYDVIQIKNTKIDVTSQYYYTYGVYANCGINSTNGGIYAANIELTNCDVTATTTKNHTAYAVWAVATATTIYKNAQPNYYGEYAGGATITVNSGTYTANTGTTTAYAIGTSARAKTTYDSESNVTAERKLGGNAEEYATLNIHGGTFSANAGSTTARAVSNGGNCTIDGGEFYATAGSSTADGIYTVSGKLKASGVKIEASATGTVYGVRVDAANVPYNTDAAWTGFNYAGDAELNNLDVTVTARTGATAYGVYLNAVSYQYTQSAFDTYMQGRIDAGKVTQANADIWAVVFPGNSSYAIAGKAVINGGKYTVRAATTTAHGIYSVNRAVSNDKVATAATEMTVKNVKLDVKTNGTTTACGIRTAGPSTIDGADIKVNSQTTTCYGMIISDQEETTVTNTKIDASGTATVYGIFVNATAPSTTNGYDWHGKAILGDGNDVTAAATAGATSYAVYLHANKATVASGEFAGNYANAAEATINGGKYTATATGGTAYAACVADPTIQGDVTATPTLIINDGKFKGTSGTTPYADVSVAGEPGYFVLNGGYYVKDENLDKKLGEGMNKVAVKSGTPEYTEGYRWRITDNMTGEAVCKITQNNTSYASLEEALQVVNASPSSEWTIVMTANATLSKGDYEIPANTTLLIPYKSNQTTANGTTPAWVNKNASPTPGTPYPYLKLTFANGVNMTVKGKIEASSTTYINQSNWTGVPGGAYGWLQLNEGSYIDLESGAYLFAWGYVTGKGEINAKNGSYIYEDFQMGDWRGGTMGSSVNGNKNGLGGKGVFLLTDYYFQNVECPITYRPGAQSIAYSGAYMEKSVIKIDAQSDPVVMVGTSNSMFLMNTATAGADTWVRKEYDAETDQLIWTLNSGASLGSFTLKLNTSWMDVDMNTEDYVLPMATNFKIIANEGDINITNDICFLPGSEAIVKKEANLVVPEGKRVFIYDADDWSSYGGYFHKIGYSPSWKACPRLMATSTKLADAKIEVAGTLDIQGSLYTTAGGGNIFSTRENAGKLKLGSAAPASTSAIADFTGNSGQNKTLCQLVGNGSEGHYVGKALTAAKLKNEDGAYTPTTGAAAGDIYAYMEDPSDGVYRWLSVKDVGCFTEIKGADTKQYIHPSDFVAVEANANGDHAYHNEGSTRYFVNAEAASGNASCVWWEAEPKGIIDGVTYYMANNENFDNYGTYFYWDNSVSYWKPKKITVIWKDKDGNKITNGSFGDSYSFNTSPQFFGANPVWANTSTEKHDWIGWRDEDGNIYDKNATLPAATADETVYTAYFETSKYQYTITFKNDDNSDLWAGLVDAGTTGAELQILFETKYNEKTGSTIPLKAPSVDKVYSFSSWNSALQNVTAAATYTASYSWTTRQYHVTFYNYDAASVLYETDVDYNTRPTYGGVTPFRANTSAFSYNWTGWQQGTNTYDTDDDLAIVMGDVYYVATFSQTDLKYQVFFKRQDGSIIDAPFFNFKETPATFPANPTLASTVSTDYTFDHWEPATLQPVMVDGMVYTAYFTGTTRQYTARFVNYDGASFGVDQTIDYNTVPVYTGTTPFKPNDSRNSFEFAGWAWEAGADWAAGSIGVGEAFPAIKGDITFTAQFTETLLQFNIIYKREDGTVIEQQKKKWGESTAFPSVSNYEDATHTYTFDHWSPATVVNPVTTDATYTAYFNQGVKTYSISNFSISPAGYGTVSPASLTGIPSGSTITVNDDKITVNGQTTVATPTTPNAQYTYTFDHWNYVPVMVTDNVTNIEAVFTRTTNTYTVTWKDADGTPLETDENVEYGATPTYNGATPAKASDEDYTYAFNGWTPAVGAIEGTTVYTATYTSTPNVASVTAGETTYYTTLPDAFTAAKEKTNPTIKLLQDVSLGTSSLTYDEANTCTLDLNGHTISGSGGTRLLIIDKANATFTVTDNSDGKLGKLSLSTSSTSTAALCAQVNQGKLYLEEGTIYLHSTSTSSNAVCVRVESGGEFIMNGGTAHIVMTQANRLGYGVQLLGGTATIFDGTIRLEAANGSGYGMYVASAATMTINGGKFHITGANAYAIHNTSPANNLLIHGGYYNTKRTDVSATSVIENKYVAPGKSAWNYYVFNTTAAEKAEVGNDYNYKVAEAYTVTFKDGDNNTIQSGLVEKGLTPIYTGATPTKAAEEDRTYTFNNTWSPAISEVTAAATYTAQFNSILNNLIVGVNTTEEVATARRTKQLIIESTGETSGELLHAENLTVDDDAYFDLTIPGGVQPRDANGKATWYAIGVPWQVKALEGILLDGKPQTWNTCKILYYNSAERAANGPSDRCWTLLEDDGTAEKVLQPGRLYMIAFNRTGTTIRFVKKTGASINNTSVDVELYGNSNTNPTDANWNGIANPSTFKAYMNAESHINYDQYGDHYGQKYLPYSNTYEPFKMDDHKLVVGQPIFVQATTNKPIVANATAYNSNIAARRNAPTENSNSEYELRITPESQNNCTDKIYLKVSDDKQDKYIIGQDLAKAGVSSKVAQMWVNRYDAKLCVNTMEPTNNTIVYPLGIYAPKAGDYCLSLAQSAQNGDAVYLTIDGTPIWNIGNSGYYLSLSEGTESRYGLLIVRRNTPATPTDLEEQQTASEIEVQKVVINGKVYILRNGEVFSITGKKIR